MAALWTSLFEKKPPYRSTIPFSREELAKHVDSNRRALQQVNNWIDEDAMSKSFFSYGVPEFLKPAINKPVGDALTYTDLMSLIAEKYLQQVNYLEIGVSVGKNFYQMLNSLDRASYTAFDIEEINPVLAGLLVKGARTEWDTPGKSIKKNRSSLSEFSFRDKKIDYISADVWDSNSWGKMEGKKFNMVFSDALHTPEAILFEFEMLVKYRLLDEQRFVIVWDDLVGKMQKSFFRIIRKYNEAYGIKDIYLLEINGWVGENEGPHSVGIISNFAF
jgi:hypothetical protein